MVGWNLTSLERRIGLCGDATRAPPQVWHTAGWAAPLRPGMPCRRQFQSEKSISFRNSATPHRPKPN
jgi:hypothetical protein